MLALQKPGHWKPISAPASRSMFSAVLPQTLMVLRKVNLKNNHTVNRLQIAIQECELP